MFNSSGNKFNSETIKEHTEKFVDLELKINMLLGKINALVDENNKIVDCIKLLDRKIEILASHFQLKYNGNSYILIRKNYVQRNNKDK
jgi:hypothetical protein